MEELYKIHLLSGYRFLTVKEKEMQVEAIKWLKKRGIPIEKIAVLSLREVDREGKRILLRKEGKKMVFVRVIKYGGSVFDRYITEVFPGLLVKPFVFPTSAWAGRKVTLGFHIREERLRGYFEQNCGKRILRIPSLNGIIEVSITNNAH